MREGLTRKELSEAANCAPYVISYLRDLGKLPTIRESTGRGVPNIYHPDAVQVIQDHLNKTRGRDQSG